MTLSKFFPYLYPQRICNFFKTNLFNLLNNKLRWAFFAARGLFSSCGERGLLFVVVRRLLIVVVSLIAEHSL